MRIVFTLIWQIILKFLADLGLIRRKPNRYLVYREREQRVIRSKSGQGNDFTLYAGPKTLATLKDYTGIEFSEIEALPQRVFDKCKELGFGHLEPVHFLLEVMDVIHPKETVMAAVKIEPPLYLEKGKRVDRSIAIYLPHLIDEIEKTRRDLEFANIVSALKGPMTAEMTFSPSMVRSIAHTKYKLGLSHELVHVFATDEYRGMMELLGLDLLELLTDSINVETFGAEYDKVGGVVKSGFAEGTAYLTNLLSAEMGTEFYTSNVVRHIRKRAKKIIHDCQQRRKSMPLPRPSRASLQTDKIAEPQAKKDGGR